MVRPTIFPDDSFYYGNLNRGTDNGSRYNIHGSSLIYILHTAFGVCDKHQKVSFAALSKPRVSGSRNKFKKHDFSTSRGKEEKNSEAVQFLLKNPLVTIKELRLGD